jgi:hypothetical protein
MNAEPVLGENVGNSAQVRIIADISFGMDNENLFHGHEDGSM